MMKIYKYHATHNDFIILDLNDLKLTLEELRALTPKLCNRRTGIGADGILAASITDTNATFMHVLNADASIAETCGNGLRAFARFLVEHKQHNPQNTLHIQTLAGPQPAKIIHIPEKQSQPWIVEVDFPNPVLEKSFEISVDRRQFILHPLSLGNPHAVAFTEDNPHHLINIYGQILSQLPQFPQQANIELIRINEDNTYDLAVYERGVGITPSCGSGTVAAAAILDLQDHNSDQNQWNFQLQGGKLQVIASTQSIEKIEQNSVTLKTYKLRGETSFVFSAIYAT